MCADLSVKHHYTVQGEDVLDRNGLCLLNPSSVKPVLPVSSGFEPSGWQSQSQRSLSFVQLCVGALTRGRATRAMLMGTKWGVSPRWITAGEGMHVFSCIHVETWDPSLFSSFLSSSSLEAKADGRSHVCCSHALLINAL